MTTQLNTLDVILTVLALTSLPAVLVAGGVAAYAGVSVPFRGALWAALLLNAASLVRVRHRADD